jgi:tetratricopeptide (TPR) repeat protein
MAFARRLFPQEFGPWHWFLVIGVAMACLFLLSLGGWAWWSSYQSRGLAEMDLASLRIREAQRPEAPAESLADAIKALESVIERYPWLSTLPQALYHLGNLRYQAKAYDRAREAYQLALVKGGRGIVATLSRLGIGYAWEAQGSYANALAAFEAALRGLSAQDFLYEELLMNIARAHELLGQRNQARDVYHRLLKDLPQRRRAEEIRARLASLAASRP